MVCEYCRCPCFRTCSIPGRYTIALLLKLQVIEDLAELEGTLFYMRGMLVTVVGWGRLVTTGFCPAQRASVG